MAKALEKLVSSAKAAGKKLLTTVTIVPFALGAFATDAAEPTNQYSSSYKFYTQGKNVTNLNTQFPAQKGLYYKNENPEIKQTGNYQEQSRPPRSHEEIEMEVERNGNDLEIIIQNTPRRETLNSRIPLQQQIYHEDPNNTHVYLVFPEGITLTKEMQSLAYINEKEKTGDLLACPPEDTTLSNVLMYFNAGVEGTIPIGQAASHSEVETAFDNVVDMVPGKYGKGIKYTKDAIVWGIKKDEEKRLDILNEKYGKGYVIHKIPTLVPQGIDLTYSYFGRTTKIKFDASELDSPQKVFVEMPHITFEQNVPGAIRKASLEGLVFEIEIGPTTSDPSRKEVCIEGSGNKKNSGVGTLEVMSDKKMEGFSFREGRNTSLENYNAKEMNKTDLIMSMSSLHANNSAANSVLTGNGLIWRVGNIPLKKAPQEFDKRMGKCWIEGREFGINNTYLVLPSDGKGLGRIRIIKLNAIKMMFKWDYTPEANNE